MNRLIIIVVCLSLTSCTKVDRKSTVKEIRVNNFPKNLTVNFEKYFDSSGVIALETSTVSLIGDINRISIFNEHIYILDRATNSVFIFDKTGKYISKIHEIGIDEGKYIGIMDFAIDEPGKRILVHSHKPYKLIYYTLDGKFLSEVPLDGFYKNINIPVKNKLLTINSTGNQIMNVIDLTNKDESGYIDKDAVSEKFKFFSTVFPNVLASNKTYITFPYSSTIYKYEENQIVPAYKINFDKKNLPDSVFNKNLTASEIYNDAMKNDYGFFISNFRETKKFLIFSYGKNSIVIYSKKDRTAESFNFVKNDQNLINFENLFGHDGKDDYVISTRLAIYFKSQMNAYKTSPKDWAKIPFYIKDIDLKLTDNSNPVLIIYKLK